MNRSDLMLCLALLPFLLTWHVKNSDPAQPRSVRPPYTVYLVKNWLDRTPVLSFLGCDGTARAPCCVWDMNEKKRLLFYKRCSQIVRTFFTDFVNVGHCLQPCRYFRVIKHQKDPCMDSRLGPYLEALVFSVTSGNGGQTHQKVLVQEQFWTPTLFKAAKLWKQNGLVSQQ